MVLKPSDVVDIADYPVIVAERVDRLCARQLALGEFALDTLQGCTDCPLEIPDLDKPVDLCGWWERRLFNTQGRAQGEVWAKALALMNTAGTEDIGNADFRKLLDGLILATSEHAKDLLDISDNPKHIPEAYSLYSRLGAVKNHLAVMQSDSSSNFERQKHISMKWGRRILPKNRQAENTARVAMETTTAGMQNLNKNITQREQELAARLGNHPQMPKFIEQHIAKGELETVACYSAEFSTYWQSTTAHYSHELTKTSSYSRYPDHLYRVDESSEFDEPYHQLAEQWHSQLLEDIQNLSIRLEELRLQATTARIARKDSTEVQALIEQKEEAIVALVGVKRRFVPRCERSAMISYYTNIQALDVLCKTTTPQAGIRPTIYDAEKALLEKLGLMPAAVTHLEQVHGDTTFGQPQLSNLLKNDRWW